MREMREDVAPPSVGQDRTPREVEADANFGVASGALGAGTAHRASGEQKPADGATWLAIGLFFAACGSLWNYLGALFHPNALTYSHAFFLEDILPTYQAAQAILRGNGPAMYSPAVVHGYTYSPFFAWIFTPLAALPWGLAGSIWYILCHVWLWLAVAALAALIAEFLPSELLKPRIGPFPVIPALTAIWLAITPAVQAELDFGQVDYLILALLATAVICIQRKRDVPAGILIVLAAMLKITPIGLLVFLIAARRWRAAVSGCATLIGIVVITSLDPRVGFGTWLRMNSGVNANLAFIFHQYANESLASIANHVLGIGHAEILMGYAVALGVGIAGLLALAVLAAVWRHPEAIAPALAAGIGVVLLSSPLNWDHTYLVASIPVVALLGYMAREYMTPRCIQRRHVVGAIAVGILAAWPSTAALSVSPALGLRLRLGGAAMVSARPLALLVVMVLLIAYLMAWKREERPITSAESARFEVG